MRTKRMVIGLWVLGVCGSVVFPLGSTLAEDTSIRGSTFSKKTKKNQYFRQAKISSQRAQKAALMRVPGQVVEAELESVKGILVYEVEIQSNDGRIHEVQVDAATGVVLHDQIEPEEEE